MRHFRFLAFLTSIAFAMPAGANLSPADAATAWAMASQYQAVVTGNIESQKIIAVFAGGKAIQIGGASVPKGGHLQEFGVVLKSGEFRISEVIHDTPAQIKGEKIWITWTEDVYLRPNGGGGSLCPPLSSSTLEGKKTIALIRYERTGFAFEHDMDLKFADWVKAGKSLAEAKKKEEFDSYDPFAE